MNKFGMVLGLAAVATLAGCKDPDYKRANTPVQNEVKDATTVEPSAPVAKCRCLPGTRHTEPCTCGTPDCQCIVEPQIVITEQPSTPQQAKPVAPVPPPAIQPPVEQPSTPKEAVTTTYIVQRGDYLAKISKKYNIKVDAIRKLNPSIKGDTIRIGQKILLPGTVDVGVQEAPKLAPPSASSTKKPYTPYTGATKEYVVKGGDTLGAIAYGNGINIRQLKELNGLTSDMLRVGQKLKVPTIAPKETASSAAAVATKPVTQTVKNPVEKSVPPKTPVVQSAPVQPPVEQPVEPPAEPEVKESAPEAVPASPAPAAANTYTVGEGEDMTAVTIKFGVSVAAICELNGLAPNEQLKPGQVIKLPPEAAESVPQ